MRNKIRLILLYLTIIGTTVFLIGFDYSFVHQDNKTGIATKVYARTNKKGFEVFQDGKWQDFFVKGINIGAALPGKWFTEFPRDEEVYTDWLEKIGDMNANCIRVYTLLPPEFYSALERYNSNHPKEILWLLQEIWPEEYPEGNNYLKATYVEEYLREIEYDIDAIHGKTIIPQRKGRAYGFYYKDVSMYVLGYLVGRELEPDEVIETNKKNTGFKFDGEYLSTGSNASPSEAWLAMNCDYVLKYEENNYNNQHPVAIVSWPTLDPQEHDSEWNVAGIKTLEYDDKVSIDINNINTETKLKAGFFGAYHIYPNYPDFMNNEIKFNDYYDNYGRLRYGGYLQEFIAGHKKYPALVAEFGLATGIGNAHTSPDGLNHGGLTEEQQGNGIIRMMKAIKKEGYAGGIVFEWMDEWAKKTWTTEPFMIPYGRHVNWHNALDPEQNYGLFAMETECPDEVEYIKEGSGDVKSIALKHDATFLYLDIDLARVPNFNSQKLIIGLDTYDRGKGEFRFSEDSDIASTTGLEFIVDISSENNAKILVHPGYNIAKNKYSSYESTKGIFEEIRFLTNNERTTKDGKKIEAIYRNYSKLHNGKFTDNLYNHWYFDNSNIHIRIPWGTLNVTDPSSQTVLDDSSNTVELSSDKLKTVKTDGILTTVLLYDVTKKEKIDLLSTSKPYAWELWETPSYKERLKKSYYMIRDYFLKLK